MKLHLVGLLVCLLIAPRSLVASFTYNHDDPYGVPLPDDYVTVSCSIDNDCATAVGRFNFFSFFVQQLNRIELRSL